MVRLFTFLIYSGEVLADYMMTLAPLVNGGKLCQVVRPAQAESAATAVFSVTRLISTLHETLRFWHFYTFDDFLTTSKDWNPTFDEICFMVRFRPFLFTALTESLKISKIISGPRLESLQPAIWPVSGACKVLNRPR